MIRLIYEKKSIAYHNGFMKYKKKINNALFVFRCRSVGWTVVFIDV